MPGASPSLSDGAGHDRADPDRTGAPGPAEIAAAPNAGGRVSGAPGKRLGQFQITYYWMASESGDKKTRRGKRERRDVQLYTRDCKLLAKVSKSFARRLAREGSGQLRDGRVINVAGNCRCDLKRCYFQLNDEQRWGVGVAEQPLSPFRTVAVDPATVAIGTVLYIPELDGLTMPGRAPYGGFVHDGCVLAADRGGSVQGKQIDLFMARKSHYRSFDRRHRLARITLYEGRGRCERDGNNNVTAVNRNSI